MKAETRIFAKGKPGERRSLVLLAENKQESKQLDFVLGSGIPQKICGSRQLADGHGEDYLSIEREPILEGAQPGGQK